MVGFISLNLVVNLMIVFYFGYRAIKLLSVFYYRRAKIIAKNTHFRVR